ncbi:UxaA family hydrolase [Flavihumibacter profundi]|jgi:altronate hydrolase|uniref:UxaA family hydrolase n=1 Tax=Flavihumibacter profundi TaxID=2716883 RepID=UPI001CC36272|nr:altronate dehydratase family protein [Flavihumibacter profundi]MBZ5859527.1 altronate dehydratase family protein [Flavihumibacter profundi]
MKQTTLKINPGDNVAVALSALLKGDIVTGISGEITLRDAIPAKHKFASDDIPEGSEVIMYGVIVGKALTAIPCGSLVTTKNIVHATQGFSLKERQTNWTKPDVSKWQQRSFMGYYRADGSVGTANHWLILPMVFCENKNVDALQEALVKALGYKENKSKYESIAESLADQYKAGKTADEILNSTITLDEIRSTQQKLFPNVDGIKILNHTLGCAGTKDDTTALCGLLAGYITHPNVAGATVLSLGCQNAQLAILEEEIHKRDPHFSKPLFLLEQQAIGNETEMLVQATKQTFAGLITANQCKREPAPLSKLVVGLECGGSDGFSGISANPALGHVSDILVALGGTVVLSEFPELCGVEQNLSDRCIDDKTAERFIQLIRDYFARAKAVGSGFDSNPSAGNIRDGLITDAMKSAGAAKKGGSSPVTAVLDYPEKITKPGLNLLCTPGSDIESTTAEVGSGATIVVFTTGLGTPTGNPIAPVVKVSTNTALFQKMNDIIDIDTGTIIDGKETVEEAGERIFETIIKMASGEMPVKASAAGHDDFIPWKRGISL